ncbi:MAG: putative Fe-S cluster assembly protein SufT [Burkholderiaceae bacterium]|nr:putative Fe-S cluster assembly protein SufT [Burkholderiaceae bacterium]
MGYRHGDIQEVTLTRDCPAVAVPWGTPTTLQAGQVGYISQQLGGTFTVMVDGNLYRIDGRHADALGLELDPSQELGLGIGSGPPTTTEAVEAAAWRVLATCYDPEIPVDIVSLGLVYGCEATQLDDGRFRLDVRMTLTAAGCGMGTLLADEARDKLLGIPNVAAADVELVWDPPWSRDMMSEAAQLEMGLL